MTWKFVPWHNGCQALQAAQSTTVIARMLGKAVKLRHCPATVSAPRPPPVQWVAGGGRISARGRFTTRIGPGKPLEVSRYGSSLGRWLKQAQVRRPVLGAQPRLRSEGNEGACHACFRTFARSPEPHIASTLYSHSCCGLGCRVPGCRHPRRGHRSLWRQGYRRQRGFVEQRKSCRNRRLRRRRQFPDSHRHHGQVLPRGLRQELSPGGDTGLLRRHAR